jgi:CRP-like cAMP-binding protein
VRKRYERDDVIFWQGEPGHGLYVVAPGQVRILDGAALEAAAAVGA